MNQTKTTVFEYIKEYIKTNFSYKNFTSIFVLYKTKEFKPFLEKDSLENIRYKLQFNLALLEFQKNAKGIETVKDVLAFLDELEEIYNNLIKQGIKADYTGLIHLFSKAADERIKELSNSPMQTFTGDSEKEIQNFNLVCPFCNKNVPLEIKTEEVYKRVTLNVVCPYCKSPFGLKIGKIESKK